jgi:hypothetical protein
MWVDAVASRVEAESVMLSPEAPRWRVEWEGLPTDFSVSPGRIHLRYTSRDVQFRSGQPVVLPSEMGFECCFSPDGPLLEPVAPGRVVEVGSQAHLALLAWLEARGFAEEMKTSQMMLVRDRVTGTVCEEWRTHEPCVEVPSVDAAATVLVEALRSWHGRSVEAGGALPRPGLTLA